MLRMLGDFLWLILLVFAAMIAGWWIIQFLDTRFGNNLIGKSARTVGNLADPQG